MKNYKLFWKGVMRSFDLQPSSNHSKSPQTYHSISDDRIAIANDWKNVGSSIRKSINSFEKQYK